MVDLSPDGCYECRCCMCDGRFVGHKREVICTRCQQPQVSREAWAVSALPVGSTVISAVFFLMLVWKDTR